MTIQSDTDALDKEALGEWLSVRIPGSGLPLLKRISGGQSNPTWFVDWGNESLVLRMKPHGPTLPGAHAIEREFRVLRALQDSDVPVPKVLWLEENPAVLGAPFYVMERLEGRVFNNAALAGVSVSERHEMYLDMARTLARLHALRPDSLGLGDYGRPGNYFERQFARWSGQYAASTGPRISNLDRLLEWLPANMPADDGAVAIAHGDFRIGNLMFHPTEPHVIGVLDWELSTLGHPLADLGFCVIPWHSAPSEYGGLLGTDWRGSGIPERAAFEAEYYAHALPTAQLTPFHVAFALFRFAVIFVGIGDRARSGSAASSGAADLAPLAERFAHRAIDVVDAAQKSKGTA